jgi:putative MATE family efflux protein
LSSRNTALEADSPPKQRTGRFADHWTVWDLAWPVIALNSLQVVNSLLDSKFVGSLGAASLTASGAAINITFLFFSIAFALGTAATALVSRFYGADDSESMAKAARQSVSLSIVLGLICSGIAAFLAPLAAHALVKPGGSAYGEMLRYIHPVIVGMPAVFVFSAVAACLRAVGDTRTPMVVSGFQILLHILLNYLLMFPTRLVPYSFSLFGWDIAEGTLTIPGANLGIAGAGIAFSISAYFSALVYLPVASRTKLGRLYRLELPTINWARRIVRIAVPASISSLIRVTSLFAFSAALKHTLEGETALGAMRVGFSMEGIAFMPAFGYMMAASALVGQSLGAKKPERAERLAWCATYQALLFTVLVSIAFILFAEHLSSWFVDDPTQQALATSYLRIIGITEPLFAVAVVLTGAHQGAGDSARPMWTALITSWFLRVPAVWLFAVGLGLQTTAAWWVMSATQAIHGFAMIWLFRNGSWKKQEV